MFKRSRTVVCLFLLWVTPALGEPMSVALDLGGLDGAAYRRLDAVQLESRAVLRLVQEGFAVVGPTAQPDLTIRLSTSATALILETSLGGRRRVVPLSDEGMRELHFEVSQKIVELAREALQARVDAGVPSDAGWPVAAVIIPDAGVPADPQAAPGAELSVGGGALYRGGASVDPFAQLDVRLPLSARLGVELRVGLTSSRGAGISILEPELLAGLGYRFELSERWTLEPRLLAGALLHVYSLDDPTAIDLAGGRLDFLMTLALSLVWRPAADLLVGLQVAPGFSSRTREHFRQGVSLWRREALRLGLGLTLGWRF